MGNFSIYLLSIWLSIYPIIFQPISGFSEENQEKKKNEKGTVT